MVRAQWDADLASSKRLQMTSHRAEAFFARCEEGRPTRPSEPLAQAAFQGASSSSRSSSSSSSSSSTSSKRPPSGGSSGLAAASKGAILPAVPASSAGGSGARGHAVPWAHKGGQSRIHGFCGQVQDGSARSLCHLKTKITTEFQTGLASARGEAETLAKAEWCRFCARILW